ncbi:hypothetical protein GCM10009589_14610 [Arthrobacter pascens]
MGFVAQLEDTLQSSLNGVERPLKTVIADNSKIVVTTRDEAGIPLSVNGEHVLSLKLDYHCVWDSNGEFLAVERSTFYLVMPSITEPLLHYDYLRSPRGDIPCAHFNVHGHRDELIYSMMAAEFKHQAKSRARRVLKGKAPRLSQLHIPTRGHRFRPCLEDLVQMVIFEFGVDTRENWSEAIEYGRMLWKDNQLASAVRDNPGKAAEQLQRMGFSVTPPSDWPVLNEKKLAAY